MQENFALEMIEKGKRIDKRKIDQFRPIQIIPDYIKKAEGSALVRLGDTLVLAGVKMEIGKPFPDTPNEGILIVNSEFSPLASPEFESGPPGEDAVELARVVDRGIRESKAIEVDKLLIKEGEKVWSVFVDIQLLNHDGNLLDAAALASVVALHHTKIPKIENEKIIRGEYQAKLPVVHHPINISVCKAGSKLFLDPTKVEEQIIDSRLSLAIREDDKICAIQKQGRKELDFEDVEKMVDLAIQKSKEMRKLVK